MSIIKSINVDGQHYVMSIGSSPYKTYLVVLSLKGDSSIYWERTFLSLGELKKGLQSWIKEKHLSLNNEDENEVFQQINEWDGVIEL